jgi:hypothetical protein
LKIIELYSSHIDFDDDVDIFKQSVLEFKDEEFND